MEIIYIYAVQYDNHYSQLSIEHMKCGFCD